MAELEWDVITLVWWWPGSRIRRKLSRSGRILQCPWTCQARIRHLLRNESSIQDPDVPDGSWSAWMGVAKGGQWPEWLSELRRLRY